MCRRRWTDLHARRLHGGYHHCGRATPAAWVPVAGAGPAVAGPGRRDPFCPGRLGGTIGRWIPSRAAQTGRRAVRFRLPTPRRRSQARS